MTGLIVNEWIEQAGGAERVLDRLVKLFPDADILCLWNDAHDRFPDRDVQESWLARTPLRRHKAAALPLMPPTWRMPRRQHDWALVSSHAFAHQVRLARPDVPKYVYAHTPARYLWAPELDARGDSIAVRLAGPPLRRIDRRLASEATSIAANSRFVADRIERSWDRAAEVIHPPVNVEGIRSREWEAQLTDAERDLLAALPESFVLGVSRFIRYKRLDVVMRAGEILDLPVVVAGFGPLEERLRALAAELSVPVQILVRPSDALVYALMSRATLFVFPPVEDFGIVAVEAMASGTPVLANRVGGSSESVADGIGGALFDPRSAGELRAAADVARTLDSDSIAAWSARFDATEFDRAMSSWVSPHIRLAS